jgi:hypothetical protein
MKINYTTIVMSLPLGMRLMVFFFFFWVLDSRFLMVKIEGKKKLIN